MIHLEVISKRRWMELNSGIALKTKRQNKGNFKAFYIVVGIIGTLLCIQESITHYTMSKYNSRIYPKVWIDNINVGGKTKEEAKETIIKEHNTLIDKENINIKVNDKNYKIDLANLNIKYDYNKVIDEAFDIGKKESILKKHLYTIFPQKEDFKLNHTYNYDAIHSVIKKIEQENNKEPINAAIAKDYSGKLVISNEDYGYKVDSRKLMQDIKSKLDNIEQKQNLLVQANLKKVEPRIKASDLKNIDSKISSFTTSFMSSNENRSANINIAANAISGKVLMPGDIFSFNDVVGERSAEKGYKMAKVIANDKLVDDLGGGVCQVSTTLYNAVLKANIASVERYHHSLPSTYVGLGMDATVAYGLLDYKFKNTLPYPIYIESALNNKNITFNIYSNNSLNNKKYDIVNELVGNKVSVFKVTYEQGKIVSRDLLYIDKATEDKG